MHLLITAGPTREYFDTVRFISNPSSGRMGFALAGAAVQRGHRVTLVAGPVSLPTPIGVNRIDVVTAAEMLTACSEVFDECDAAIMTAAVCDYRPAQRLDCKLQKQSIDRHVTLEPTQDICATLGRIKEHRVVIGFALEDRDHHSRAERKLTRKNCDAMILNEPSNIGSDQATIEILTTDQPWQPPVSGSKSELAHAVLQLAEELASSRSRTRRTEG